MPVPECSETYAAGDAVASYLVAVTLWGRDQSVLLALVSALHRRGVEVVTAQLTEPIADQRRFDATISMTARQARNVEATLGNLVFVADVEVAPLRTLAAVGSGSAM